MAKTARKFWVIPGDIDPKTGKPKEYGEKPSTFILSGVGQATGLSKQPVEVTEEMSEDGEYVQYVAGPDGQRQEINRGVDTGQLSLHQARSSEANRAADNTRADQAATREKTPAPQTLDQARLTAAQAASAEAAAAKAASPPMIERPRPNAGLLDTGVSATERVTKDQADYDRQAAADLLARTQAAEKQIHDDAVRQIQQGQLDNARAVALANERMDALRIEVQRESNAITRRGQDIQAETSRRGQDMTLQGSREGDFMRLAGNAQTALVPGYAQPEQWSAIRSGINQTRAIGGQAPLPDFRGGPPPFDPIAFAQQAQQASRYVLPGQPPPAPPGGPYVMRPG